MISDDMVEKKEDRQLPDEKLHDLTRAWGLAREQGCKVEEEAFARLYAYIELERCSVCPFNPANKKEINNDKSES